MTTPPATGTVLPLTRATDHLVAGRKAATLARLAGAGFPVPPGVVLPAAVLDQSADRVLELPAGIAAELPGMVAAWGEVALAVRSSGLDEDGAHASYAGQFTSVLNVRGPDELLVAVRQCWSSASDPRVASYAGGQPLRLAVLIQPMVPATAAGVAFTADPVTGERGCVLIDAVVGTAERLAAGAVTPDRWIVRDEQVMSLSRPTDSGNAPARSLDERQARIIADMARRVEAELGQPQDIEWALVGNEIALLQARPITALPVEPVPVPVEIPAGYWTREASHVPPPWLPFSLAVYEPRNAALRRTATEFGLLFDGIELRQIGGWEYMRVVPLGGKEPPRLPHWLVPVAFRLVPALRRRLRGCVVASRADQQWQIRQQWSHEWLPDFDSRTRALRDCPPAALSDPALASHLNDVLKLTADGLNVHMWLHGALAGVLGEFALTCRDLLGWDDTRMWSLLCGTSATSTRPAIALAEMAAQASPAVRSLLERRAPATEVLGADERFAAAFHDLHA